MNATVRIDTRRSIGPVDPRLFGGFVEHLGRVVYGGLYDPESRVADEHGWRADVLAALRHLGFAVIRYPGGNFASGYHWEDGVGPIETRKEVLDHAWNTIEPNLIGTDEFLQLCVQMGWEPMLTVNLGSGRAEEAAAWVVHCRRHRGGVRLWCLGNEMDGDWQIGHAPAPEYVSRASDAARAMRSVESDIKLVACGSSSPEMPTYYQR